MKWNKKEKAPEHPVTCLCTSCADIFLTRILKCSHCGARVAEVQNYCENCGGGC